MDLGVIFQSFVCRFIIFEKIDLEVELKFDNLHLFKFEFWIHWISIAYMKYGMKVWNSDVLEIESS